MRDLKKFNKRIGVARCICPLAGSRKDEIDSYAVDVGTALPRRLRASLFISCKSEVVPVDMADERVAGLRADF